MSSSNGEKKGRRILVTGGTGLVGKGIEEAVKCSDHYVNDQFFFLSSKEGNLLTLEDTKRIFEKYKPTHVIHLAAMVGGLFRNLDNNLQFFRDNMAMNDNVLACCKEYKVQKCVSCLSTCIFPDQIVYPLDETKIHLGSPHPSNEGYAYAKRMLDILNKCYMRNDPHGCKFHSVIPTNIFGPHDNFNLKDSHVLPGLIHKCYLSRKKNEPFVVWGTGKALRQFIYSLDLGKLFLWVLDKYDDLEPVILSVGEEDEISIADAAKLIADEMGYTKALTFDSTKSDGQFKKTASNKKLLSLYPEFKFTPIKQAIHETVKWFEDNYETARK